MKHSGGRFIIFSCISLFLLFVINRIFFFSSPCFVDNRLTEIPIRPLSFSRLMMAYQLVVQVRDFTCGFIHTSTLINPLEIGLRILVISRVSYIWIKALFLDIKCFGGIVLPTHDVFHITKESRVVSFIPIVVTVELICHRILNFN